MSMTVKELRKRLRAMHGDIEVVLSQGGEDFCIDDIEVRESDDGELVASITLEVDGE